MAESEHRWTLLVYRIPSQPSRLRLQVWRKLQGLGAAYLQDAVCVLPAREDLQVELEETAQIIRSMGGTATLFHAVPLHDHEDDAVIKAFKDLADERYRAILGRIESALQILSGRVTVGDVEVAEESLMRERVGFLRAQRLAYIGGTIEPQVEEKLEQLRKTLDEIRAALLA
ncbi:MAG TPA: Chromate resistance protein ChrB [Fimbriimonas sp.]|nr:Chromate resistance protein ChrB [Fimbriimonas sp.]